MGVCPSFFRLAHADPKIARGLFDLAKFAYLDSPLPPLFKEKLFTYLSRFCPVRYCVSRHAAFLIGRGYVAGDPSTPALPVEDVAALLTEPLPSHQELPELLAQLEREAAPLKNWPDFDSNLGRLFRIACAMIVTERDRAPEWCAALRRLLGAERYEQLMLFLAFVRTAHFWTEVHPELQPEQDVERLLHEHEALAAPILNRGGDTERALVGSRFYTELIELREASALADALRENERRLDIALRAGRMGAWEWDIATNKVTWSPALEELHGLSPGTFGGTFEDFQRDIHPDDRQRVLEAVQEVVRACTHYHVEYRIVRPDEELRWVEARGELIFDEGGNPIRMVGVCADVTERHHAEEETEHYRRWMARVADTSPDVIFVYDVPEQRIVYANQTLSKVLGYQPEEFIEIEDILGILLPEAEQPAAESFFAGLADASPGEVRVLTHRALHKDGSSVWLEDRVTPFQWDANGKVAHAIGVATDISHRKRSEEALKTSEERYRAIVESQSEMVCRFRPDGTILFVNGAYARARGTTSEKLQAQNFWDFVDEGDQPQVRAMLDGLRPETPEVRIENRFETVEGARWTLWTNRALMFDAKGHATEVQSSGIDITQRKLAEEALQRKTSALETINRVNLSLASNLQVESLIQAATDAAKNLSGAAFGAFFYNDVDSSGEKYMLYTLSGVPREAFERFGMPRNTAVFAPTFNGAGIVRSDDITRDPRYGKSKPHRGMPKGHLPVRSYLAVPVISRTGEVHGGLFLGHPEPGVFTNESEQIIAGIAAQAAIAIDNAHLYEELSISEESFRGIFDMAGVSVWVEDFAEVKAAVDTLRKDGVKDFRAYVAEHPEFVRHCIDLVRIVDVNDETVRLFEAQEKTQLLGSLGKIFTPETERLVSEEIVAIAEGRTAFRTEASMQTLAGRPISTVFSVHFPPPDADHRRVVVTLTDISDRKQAEGSVRIRALQQQAIATLGELALREADLQAVFDEATAMVAETLDVEYCKVLELLPGGAEVLLRSGIGWKDGLVGNATVDTGLSSQAGYTLSSNAPVVVADLRTDTRFRGPTLLTDHGVVSGMSCTIHGSGGSEWGVLGTHSTRKIAFTPEDANFLVAVANVLSAAIQRKEAEVALREREEGFRELSSQLKLLLGTTSNLIETLETEELLRTLLDQARQLVVADAFAVWRVDAAGYWSVVSQEGLSEEFLQQGSIFAGLNVDLPPGPVLVQPQDLSDQSTPLLRDRWARYTQEGIRSLMILPLRIHGVVSGTLVFYCRTPHFFTETEVESAQALANIAAAAITTSELYESQSQVRRHAEDAAVRESFLAAAGAILAESLEFETTLGNVARAAVPHFADWCAVDLLDEHNVLRRIAVAHVDPERVALAQRLFEDYPPDKDLDLGVYRVLHTGESEMMSDIPQEVIASAARDKEHLRLIQTLNLTSYICVPLRIENKVRGAITFVTSGAHRHFQEPDLRVAQDIARRSDQAIENARLYRNLRASEERLQLLTDAMPALVGRLDHQLVYSFVNRAYAAWFQMPREKIIGRHIRDVVGKATFKIIGPRLEQALAGETVQFEDTLPYARGGTRYVLANYIPERGDDGAVRGVYVMVHDITARRQIEERLAESEREFRAMFELAGAGKAQTDPETNQYTRVNRKLCEMTGYSEEELLGFTPADITHPDDRAEDEERSGRVRRGEEQVWVSEKRYIRKDGDIVWVLVTGSAIRDDNGKIVRTIATIQNISDRKRAEEALRESEEKFRAIADNIAQLAWMTDEKGMPVWCNKRWYDYTGTTFEQIGGLQWNAVHHPDHVDRVIEKFNRHVELGKVWEDTFPLRGCDGEFRWFLSRAIPIRDESGKVVRWFGTNTDITERKEAEEALQAARDELEERVRERTAQLRLRNEQLARLASELTLTERRERRRVADILHDHLQQLLVGAKLGLDILAREANEHQREAVAHVKELIDEGIKASRTLTVELSPPILHDAGLAAGLDWLARWMKEKHGLEVKLEVDEKAKTDREDVRVLLFESARELLFNVVKHAQTTTASVKLWCYDDRHLCVTVRDNGPGFNVDSVLASGTRTNSGFGLFSIRERFSLLGGRVDIESRPGAGACFTLIAPIREAVESRPREGVVSEHAVALSYRDDQRGGAQQARGRMIRVLVVDDHNVMRQGLTMLLSGERDIQVVGEAADGVDAIEQALVLRPDVVLMDFSMPRMDGVEATRHIVEALPHVRVIGLSMYEEPDRAAAMMSAGAAAYRSKSGDSEEILQAIRGVHPTSPKIAGH